MNKIKLILIASFLSSMAWGQTAMDALRFSTLTGGGTARTLGVGGAIGALGADYSVASINPAGMARYRRSEVVFTPSIYLASADSELEGGGEAANTERKTNFNFNNIGLVLSNQPRGFKWKASNFGIGFNRLANFNQEFFFQGTTRGSYTDRLIELADGLFPSELDGFEAGLGFDVGAIYNPDPDNDETFYQSDFIPSDEVNKSQRVTSSGSINELVFSLAGNYNEKLMIGVTVGVPFFSYQVDKEYREEDAGDQIPFFNALQFDDNLTTSGVGINAKLGLIYHVTKMVRLGAAVHSPTFISLTDNWSTSLEYDYTDDNNSGPIRQDSEPGSFDYKLRTPLRAIGSVGFLFQKLGFLSADIEWVNYGAASYNLTANSTFAEDAAYEEEVNQEIDNNFTSAINIRVGGEYALKKIRIRAGFGLNGTPYAADNITNSNYSLGLGYRSENFFIDLGYRKSLSEEEYIPYQTIAAPQQLVNNSFNNDNLLLTFGFKF